MTGAVWGVEPACLAHGHRHEDAECDAHGWGIVELGEDDPPIAESPYRDVAERIVALLNAAGEARDLRERLAAAIHHDYEAAVEAGHSDEFMRVYLAANTEALRIVRERP